MVHSCSAFGCTNRFKKGGVGFFRFPSEEPLRSLWIRAVSRENWTPSKASRICGLHFQTGKPSHDADHPDHVPNIFSFQKGKKVPSIKCHERRKSLQKKRSQVHVENEVASINDEDHNQTPASHETNNSGSEVDDRETELASLHMEIQALRAEKKELEEALKRSSNLHILEDEGKLHFYTGLPNKQSFDWLLRVMEELPNSIQAISKKEQLLIVLMKLKLNLFATDLAYRFKTSRRTVGRIFKLWLEPLAAKLQSLIKYPSKRALKQNVPEPLKTSAYKNCSAIIDCTEVGIERPSSLKSQSQTYSSYKHGHTIKFLVATTPSGCVSFVSKCWGGRTSDKEITIKSGFLDLVRPGDLVLADRGFIVNDYFVNRGANLVIPAFKKGVKQMSRFDVMRSKKVSNVRIHVERVIRQIKRFQILKGVIPLSFLNYIDFAVVICAALSNLCCSIVDNT